MKRFIAGAFATALLVAGLSMTASPASAHLDTCTGQGTATTNPVFYPTMGPSATGAATFTFTVGGCVLTGVTTVNGAFDVPGGLTGNYCGNSTGTITVDHHTASWTSAGSVLVLTGGATGVVNAVPNVAAGQSCTTGATLFLVTGSVESV